jgi:hypothetical protein
MIQIDGTRRKVFIKFIDSNFEHDILQTTNATIEYKHTTGEISLVRLEIAGMGTRPIRLANLPTEPCGSAIRTALAPYLSLQRHYSPGWASASLKSFLHPSRFRATTVQFLHPSFAISSFTPSSQRNLGLRLGRFPPGSLRRILLERSSSSWRMTCPDYLNLLILQNFTISFSPYN